MLPQVDAGAVERQILQLLEIMRGALADAISRLLAILHATHKGSTGDLDQGKRLDLHSATGFLLRFVEA
jgi:hypothetical protein